MHYPFQGSKTTEYFGRAQQISRDSQISILRSEALCLPCKAQQDQSNLVHLVRLHRYTAHDLVQRSNWQTNNIWTLQYS